MNRIAPLLLLAATVATAQTTTPAAPKTGATTVHHTAATGAAGVKLPPGVPPVRGLMKTAFALRYQEVRLGTGAIAEPNKLYKVKYTGWLASDGKKFDSSEDHPGKEPIQFPQGRGRVIPGWDQGFEGMRIGGRRRLFIPYQLAYGVPGRPPVIPGKSDLIFDIELVDMTEIPTQGGPGGMMGRPRPTAPTTPPAGSAPGQAPAAPSPGQPTSPQAPQAPPPAPGTSKPVDPTAPTVSPNSAAPSAAPAPSAPATPPPTAQPDKPANPAQPNPSN